jgi:uncharacterized protein (DUF3084 family)
MSDVNYGESIIIPTLQKKVQELQNTNLVLEVSLLVEQARSRDLSEKMTSNESSLRSCNDQLDGEINRATSFAHEANQLRSEVGSMSARITTLENDLRREISVKESILAEYRSLKETHDALMAENNALKAEVEQLKNPVVETKKKAKAPITQVQA